MWSCRHDLSKHLMLFNPFYCTCIYDIGLLDFNRFNGCWNRSIDFKNSLNNWILWGIDYTQASTMPITKIQTRRANKKHIGIFCCNNYFKHRITKLTGQTNSTHSMQSSRLECDHRLSGCSVSGRKCTASRMVLKRMILVVAIGPGNLPAVWVWTAKMGWLSSRSV